VRVKAGRGAEGTSRSWQRWRGRGGRAELRAAVAHANGDSREGEIRPGKGEDDAWSSSQQEVARRRRQSGGQGRSAAPVVGRGRAEHVPEEEEEKGAVRGTCLEIPRISGTSR
jgi:hypothetical protein